LGGMLSAKGQIWAIRISVYLLSTKG